MNSVGKAARFLLWGLGVAVLLAACSQQPAAPAPAAGATPPSLATSPQGSRTPAATLEATSTTSASPLPAATTTPASLQPTVVAAAKPGPLPELLARVTLAAPDTRLEDLLLDRTADRLYVTDTGGKLHILDAARYDELMALPAAGVLTLDTAHDRLYASPLYGEGQLTVVDTASLTVTGTISPGGFVAVDSIRNRFYVGNPVFGSVLEGTPGVQVYDGVTLQKMGQVTQPGIPVYNPLRDELYVIAYTVHIANPETLEVTGDLLPEITSQPLAWCNGCWAATNAHVYPDSNLLVVDVTILSPGKGPGTLPPPRFFDATTLLEITDPAEIPPVERACGDRLVLAEPVDGRVYRGESYSRYVFYNNLLVFDLAGDLATWRDGLALGLTNPHTGQMYLPYGDETLVLDLTKLSPVGSLPPVCIHTLDTETGRVYGLLGRDLVVFAERGGWPAPAPAVRVGTLPAEQIEAILPSPDYAHDRTLFVTAPGTLFRSTDGGRTWAQLRGGLPQGDYLTLDLALSPAFGTDRTLYAGGSRGDFWGEGVYRSTDGGDTWQPAWDGMLHLRVYDVALSPGYAVDGTLLAYSRYQRLTPWQSGLSLFRSDDQGLSWTLVMTQSQENGLPPPDQLLPQGPAQPAGLDATDVRFREADYGQSVERSSDGGRTWEPVTVTRQPGFAVQEILASPNYASDHTVYVLSEFELFRSKDGGESWAHWIDGRLGGRDYSRKLTTAAVSPPLDAGRYQLFVGTAAGEFWALEPGQMTWEPVRTAEPWPAVLPGEWVGEIAPAPDGGVWLGTWGDGVAHYAGGAIQARYTITDGLPTQYIGGLAAAPDGTLWAGGDLPASIGSFDGREWTLDTFGDEPSVGGLLDIAIGRDGTLWAGTQYAGLLHQTRQGWQAIADPEGVSGGRINDIQVDASGTLWCATARGLVFYGDGGWRGQGGDEAYAIEFGPAGTADLLVGGGSVWRYAGGQWAALPPAQEERYQNSQALHVARDGAVWVGTQNGAFRFDGQAWRPFTAQDGLPANEVVAITEDVAGWLWFGTESGAARVNPATLKLSPVAWPALPTATPAPKAARTPTPAAQIVPTPTPCGLLPAEPFATAFRDSQISDRLGCPAAEATFGSAAFQPFELGLMFWRMDNREIDVLQADGAWQRFADTWDESQPASDPALTPPEGLLQPVRGFGKVWREQLGSGQAQLGWALAAEQRYEMWAQSFAHGQMITGPGGTVHVLYIDGAWTRIEKP